MTAILTVYFLKEEWGEGKGFESDESDEKVAETKPAPAVEGTSGSRKRPMTEEKASQLEASLRAEVATFPSCISKLNVSCHHQS